MRTFTNSTASTLFLMLIAMTFHTPVLSAEGFSGRIFFRSGNSVAYVHLGKLDKVVTYRLWGKLGGQEVRFKLSEVKKLVFDHKGDDTVMVVGKGGDRFTISPHEIRSDPNITGTGGVGYVYHDPITRKLQYASAEYKHISHISIGDDAGDVKVNPTTGEYFPAMYVFDPFTGEKLKWSTRAAVR